MNAVNWMIEKATVETLSDGTVTYFFEGNIPSRMRMEIIDNIPSKKHGGYGINAESYDYTIRFGQYISTQNHVKFTYNDYTVPLKAMKGE